MVVCRWATIAATTLTARACLFPITLYQMRATARLSVRPTDRLDGYLVHHDFPPAVILGAFPCSVRAGLVGLIRLSSEQYLSMFGVSRFKVVGVVIAHVLLCAGCPPRDGSTVRKDKGECKYVPFAGATVCFIAFELVLGLPGFSEGAVRQSQAVFDCSFVTHWVCFVLQSTDPKMLEHYQREMLAVMKK